VLLGRDEGAARAAAPHPAPPAPVALSPTPPALAVLEQEMRQLAVNSERYTTAGHGFFPVDGGTRAKPRLVTHRYSVASRGIASIAPEAGETWDARTGVPKQIVLPGHLFFYSSRLGHRDHGRPWVSVPLTEEPEAFPYHGSSRERPDGGSGPYARLLNLLGTARAAPKLAGTATVAGRPATEFSALVDPLMLVRGLPATVYAKLLRDPPYADRLQVFIDESGLPVRVVETAEHNGHERSLFIETTEILSVGDPLAVAAPAAALTISAAQAERFALRGGLGTVVSISTG
jgi:hypothetical protein